jgi:hypothetical protein
VAELTATGYQLFDYDYCTFKLFGLSILWRSHVSSLHQFAGVDLGPHAEVIRSMLHREDPGAPLEYGFLIIRLLGSAAASRLVQPLAPTRLSGVVAYAMRANGFEWIFTVSRHIPGAFNEYPFVGTEPKLQVIAEQLDNRTVLLELRDMMKRWGKL